MTTTENLPAVQPNAVEQVKAALADREWDGVEDGHIGGTVAGKLPRTLLNRKVDGGFTDELSGEVSTETTFVWLADTVTRAYWPEAFGKGEKKPTCRSKDGITPEPDSPEVQSEKCSTCPHSKWNGDDAPACARAIEVMAYLLKEQRLTLIRFGGMAVSRVERYLGALEYRIPCKPPLAYVTRCELVPEDTDNGKFLVPRFSVAGEIPRAEATPLIELRHQRVLEWQEQLNAEVAEGSAADAQPGPFDEAEAKVAATFGADGAPFVDEETGEEF